MSKIYFGADGKFRRPRRKAAVAAPAGAAPKAARRKEFSLDELFTVSVHGSRESYDAAPKPTLTPTCPTVIRPGVYRVVIPCHPPLLNQIMFCKVKQRIQLSARWKLIVASYFRHAGVPGATCKRRVWIHIVLAPGGQAADPDAYYKATGDALKTAGMLVSDSRHGVSWTDPTYGNGPRAEIVYTLQNIA